MVKPARYTPEDFMDDDYEDVQTTFWMQGLAPRRTKQVTKNLYLGRVNLLM